MNEDYFTRDTSYTVFVKANSSKNECVFSDDRITITLIAKPINNEANRALIKFFKKEFGLSVEILKGQHTRHKLIRIT